MAITETGRIARRNARITFQKRTITVDKYQNRLSSWEDYFSCFAYANTFSASEEETAVTTEERQVTFETRYCPELSAVTSTEYRVIFQNEGYNIESVDMMNYQNKTLKFTCRREKRKES